MRRLESNSGRMAANNVLAELAWDSYPLLAISLLSIRKKSLY
jgi:hypothetical protein